MEHHMKLNKLNCMPMVKHLKMLRNQSKFSLQIGEWFNQNKLFSKLKNEIDCILNPLK